MPIGLEPRAINRFGHRGSPRQLVPHPLRPLRHRVGFWRDASDGFEDTMEVIAAHADRGCECVEAGQCLGVFNDTPLRCDRQPRGPVSSRQYAAVASA